VNTTTGRACSLQCSISNGKGLLGSLQDYTMWCMWLHRHVGGVHLPSRHRARAEVSCLIHARASHTENTTTCTVIGCLWCLLQWSEPAVVGCCWCCVLCAGAGGGGGAVVHAICRQCESQSTCSLHCILVHSTPPLVSIAPPPPPPHTHNRCRAAARWRKAGSPPSCPPACPPTQLGTTSRQH
jgi:hypothetical protein